MDNTTDKLRHERLQSWLRKIYPTLTDADKEEAGQIFPGVLESEDERIRRAILIYLDWLDGRKGCQPKGDYTIRDMIASLEKQKEEADRRLEMVEQHCKNVDELGEKIKSLQKKLYGKQKEQKSAEWDYPYGKNETVDKLLSIAECLEMDGDCLFNGYSGTECGKFLRELARKQIECKPAEWSEEDENIYNKALDAIYYKDLNDKDEVVDSLKSLCDLISRKRKVIPPYARWKPSEEQMAVLKNAIHFYGKTIGKEVLESLYNDLQKLL